MSWFQKLAQKARAENERDFQVSLQLEEERKAKEAQKATQVCATCRFFGYAAGRYQCFCRENMRFTFEEIENGVHERCTCSYYRRKL